MEMIEEPSKKLAVIAETEVLVVGGGPAGISAALGAARAGVDVMIVERYGCFGGVITQAMIGTVAWYRYAQTVDAGGIGLEFEKRSKTMDASIDIFGKIKNKELVEILEQEGLMVEGKSTYEVLDTEMFKFVIDDMIREANI
ncbi:MAG: FAD-dependent oxidoreductase [Candidatus Lokiarchaeota archaeon]|nr:FAD-dependent oxidoreductase [Candidatus Lokiarchaeota archaeon]